MSDYFSVTEASRAASRAFEDSAQEFMLSLRGAGNRNVSILMVGRGGSGKTSLANALLKNNSCEGNFGPRRGNDMLFTSKREEVKTDVVVTVNDIMGFEDLDNSNDAIKNAVVRGCEVNELTAVVVCFKWDD